MSCCDKETKYLRKGERDARSREQPAQKNVRLVFKQNEWIFYLKSAPFAILGYDAF